MLQNYEYFLKLAEKQNISRAAEELYISHQCLSRYLKTLEEECGVTLFTRKPTFELTEAGKVLRDSLREVQHIEQNTLSAFEELKSGQSGVIHLGITEGRLRIFLPQLLTEFQKQFPKVEIHAVSTPTRQMVERLLENKLDLVIGSTIDRLYADLKYTTILDEEVYLVVSDNLLRQYFPDSYPQCKKEFAKGADIRAFREMPFCLVRRGYNSRTMIDDHLQKCSTSLNVVYEAEQPDLLHIMTSHDYGASLCLTMFLPYVEQLNRTAPPDNQLNVFPIRGMEQHNPIFIITRRERYFPRYTKELMKLIRRQCSEDYEQYLTK